MEVRVDQEYRFGRVDVARRGPSRAAWGLLLVSLALQACAGRGSGRLEAGEAAPPFTLPAAAGGEVSLGDYQGTRPVLLFFHMALG